MNFAPVAFQGQTFWNNLVVNLWQGNYTANSTTWDNLVPGGVQPTSLPSTGFTKNATGVIMRGVNNSSYFTLPTSVAGSNGSWDTQPNWTIVTYGNITGTTNQMWWRKQSSGSNGHATLYSNNPICFVRAPGSSNQIYTTGNVTGRGSLTAYSFVYSGVSQGLWYVNKVSQATTNQSSATANLNAPYDFIWAGNGTTSSWGSNAALQIQLNRLLIFNKPLDGGELGQVIDFCTQNQ
jgi:hypothetical protein